MFISLCAWRPADVSKQSMEICDFALLPGVKCLGKK